MLQIMDLQPEYSELPVSGIQASAILMQPAKNSKKIYNYKFISKTRFRCIYILLQHGGSPNSH
jgi:hypothetical protein